MNQRRASRLFFVALAPTLLVLAAWIPGPGHAPKQMLALPTRGRSNLAGDWPMLGGTPQRNLVNLVDRNLPDDWDVKTGKNVKWVAHLGSNSYGGPVIAGGRIFIGTNNGAFRNPRDVEPQSKASGKPGAADKGILLCLRESDGRFLWQAVHDKLASGRVNDWPQQGIASAPCVEGDRVYYVSNRCELVCADVEGFANGNQGLQDEQYQDATDADIIWRLDMMKELGVFPHNLAASSPLVLDDLVFVVTGNGHDQSHEHIPAPEAPSFVAVDKRTGKVVWHNNAPGKKINHGQWSSPTVTYVGGRPQVIFPGGDGWLWAFEPKTGNLVWKFDCNPKSAKYIIGPRGTRNDFVAPAVAYDGRVYVTVGQDPEHGMGVGHLWCIDPNKATTTNVDLSPVNDNFDPKAPENRRSGLVWHLGGKDEKGECLFRRSLSFCAIHDGLCFVADLSGFVYCVDAVTGQRYWEYDLEAPVWGAPYWVDDKIFLGTDEGDVAVFAAARACRLLRRVNVGEPVLGTIVAAHGVLYVKTNSKLYAVAASQEQK